MSKSIHIVSPHAIPALEAGYGTCCPATRTLVSATAWRVGPTMNPARCGRFASDGKRPQGNLDLEGSPGT